MKVKYTGKVEGYKIKRKELSKEYDFSKGPCEVTKEDAKILLGLYGGSFEMAYTAESTSAVSPEKKPTKKKPTKKPIKKTTK